MTLQLDADRPADVLDLDPNHPLDVLELDPDLRSRERALDLDHDLDRDADLASGECDIELDLDAQDVDESVTLEPRRIALVIGAGLLLALVTALAATALIAGRSSALFDVVGGALIEQASSSPLDRG